MHPKSIFLTIDDAPSRHTQEIVQYLKESRIPAIFFCRGEFIKKRMEAVEYIIEHGFLVGNHSYTHPFFSEISLDSCFDEIKKTETLIEKCYKNTNKKRHKKIIRLPFGDRGAGKGASLPANKSSQDKSDAIQQFLKENHFESILPKRDKDQCIDIFWDWDTQDYREKFIHSPKDYLANLEHDWANISSDLPIMMIHDFDHNYILFGVTMQFLKENHIKCEDYDRL